jgi:hypothetical protein
LPAVGLLELTDAETGRRALVDTSSAAVRHGYAAFAAKRRADLARAVFAADAELIEVSTDGGHLDALVRFFQRRTSQERRMKAEG